MTPADMNFAAVFVRALNMVAQASREWLAAKREQFQQEQQPKNDSDDNPQR